jgi:Domain of unknown function (DUF4333)
MHLRIKRTPVALAGLSIAVAIAGCGGATTLSNPDKTVSAALFKAVGQHPASVSCPANIPAKVGHVFRCTISDAKGNKIGATVTEMTVSGSTTKLHIVVDR